MNTALARAPELEELEDLEIDLLLTALVRRYGYDFRDYAPASLRRRIRRVVQLERLPSISALQEQLLHQPAALARFVSALSVHVTAMFRDPTFYRALREHVVPRLKTYPFVRIWHAGCSTGEEAYSLAILLEEEGLYDRCRIYATDISPAILEQCQRGDFPLAAMQQYTTNYLQAGGNEEFSRYYVADHKRALLDRALRRNIVFAHHNLVSDGPFNEFQLVVCRNVMIYFNGALRDRVHQLIYDSLAPFGMLAVGLRESLQHSQLAHAFETVDADVRLYRRRQ